MKKIIILLVVLISFFSVILEINASDTINILVSEAPQFDFDSSSTTCANLLGNNLVLVVKFGINALRIAGVIVAIIMAMTKLLPAVNKGDAGELNKALKKCIWIAVVLIIVVMFPTLIRVIGKLFGLDIGCI